MSLCDELPLTFQFWWVVKCEFSLKITSHLLTNLEWYLLAIRWLSKWHQQIQIFYAQLQSKNVKLRPFKSRWDYLISWLDCIIAITSILKKAQKSQVV